MLDNLPRLYSKSESGKILIWEIKVEQFDDYSNIVTQHGLEDGKITIATRKISKGKNIGKKNETDHFSQAISEARYRFDKKIHQGYSINRIQIKEKNKLDLPMLAQNFEKMKHKVKYPCYVQPKLDGIRCLYSVKQGVFYTRTGHSFNDETLKCVKDQIHKVSRDIVLDGELYSNTLNFQEISGILRKEKLATKDDFEKAKQIVYIVYDYIPLDKPDETFENRHQHLKKIGKNFKKCVSVLETFKAQNEQDVIQFHSQFVEQGYEGAIVRNFSGLYGINKRSADLQKLKSFDDEEFKITGYKSGNGIEKDLVIWKAGVLTKSGYKEFYVRPVGTHEERKKLLKNADNYIGKLLTVKFFGYTEDGIPRFPIGLRIREII